jgi:hypothetical protein
VINQFQIFVKPISINADVKMDIFVLEKIMNVYAEIPTISVKNNQIMIVSAEKWIILVYCVLLIRTNVFVKLKKIYPRYKKLII